MQRYSLKMYFYDQESPSLGKVEFIDSQAEHSYLSVRGKTGSAYDTDRTFQWTSAVQALAILFLRLAVLQRTKNSSNLAPLSPALEGGKGSIVVSLDYALDKQPRWLLDMFGVTSNGRPLIRQFLTRSNPGLRRSGPLKIKVVGNKSSEIQVAVFWDDCLLEDDNNTRILSRLVEKQCGTLDAKEVSQEIKNSPVAKAVPRIDQQDILNHKPVAHAGTFKTPFVREGSQYGDVFVRVYQHEGKLALVSLFCPLDEFDNQRAVPVRVHSSCMPSDVLLVTDCDCRSQLEIALKILSKERGVLVHLFQEGRGVGLFSKYLGMSMSTEQLLDTYEAFDRMNVERDGRDYQLASMVLRDLNIGHVELLTNNKRKVEGLESEGLTVSQRSCFGELTPQNISYLYTKMKKGNHLLEKLFTIDSNSDTYTISNAADLSSKKRVWFFAGDDTLWEDNIVYEDIIRQFLDFIGAWIPAASRSEIRNHLDSVEKVVISEKGFGPLGFEHSLRRCFAEVCEQYSISIPDPNDLFESVVPRTSSVASDIPHGTFDVLSTIRDRGDGMVLYTQGPKEIQLRKIASSKLGYLFDVIAVVEKKTVESYESLAQSLSLKSDQVFVVGSSIDADVVPATSLHFRTYFLRNPNSWHMLNSSQVDATKYKEIFSLKQVLQND